MNFSKVKEKIKNMYPKGMERSMSYGTAGFRGPANNLDWVMFRMGLLAVLRSKHKQGRAIGAMITASHNPVGDNGIKLIDPKGEMLELAWENAATELVNAGDAEVTNVLETIIGRFGIDLSNFAVVFVAQDTRPSSQTLSVAVREGVEALGASARDFHLLTTPQLHHIVNVKNSTFGLTLTDLPDATDSLPLSPAEDPSEEGYYTKTLEAFVSLLHLNEAASHKTDESHYESDIYVDGANGIGAMKLAELRSRFTGFFDVRFPTIRIFNDGKDGLLNENCGADFVKVAQKPSKGAPIAGGVKYASFDGDADRLVYFYFDEAGHFHLLDGDKIAALLSAFFVENVRLTGLDLKIGVIQTAYANGASTNYIKDELKVPVDCVPTGVKHLHHKAQEYDIGIYFEANGHGTVVYSENANHRMRELMLHIPQQIPQTQKPTSPPVLPTRATPVPSVIGAEEKVQDLTCLDKENYVEPPFTFPKVDPTEKANAGSESKPDEQEAVKEAVLVLPNTDLAAKFPPALSLSSTVMLPGRAAISAVEKLSLVGRLVNQTVGDALADLLLVEAILFLRGLSVKQWDEFYQDLPNRQLKVKVSNRDIVQTTDAERVCSSPTGLQAAIDSTVKRYASARAFVRPSGTEDVVRVYAEADSQENADRLAQEVAIHVFQMAGGVGPAPSLPKPHSTSQPAPPVSPH